MSESSEMLEQFEFYDFCKALRIDSKERGLTSLGQNMLGTQQLLLDKVRAGMERGVREFVTLKCRQIGISTLSLACDLYWIYKYRGLNAALVTHEEGAREQFRTTLALYRSGLPDEWQRDVVDDNRNQLVLDNGSRLRFLVAGTRARTTGSSRLGRSGALVMAHMTEPAFWGDATGVDALRASFAQTNPIRFFHWESTANGLNWFYDMYQDARASKSVDALFISWWANEYYAIDMNGALFAHYWGKNGKMTAMERQRARSIKQLYGVELSHQQLAWYRWMAAEKITDELQLRQEFPDTEEDAFIASGSAFFRTQPLTDAHRVARALKKDAQHYRIECGTSFADTRVNTCKVSVANLTVWAEPVTGAWYVLGVDPAYASSPDSNNSAISIWRCWYNHIEQVAEFVDQSISTHACAWIFAYLAGHYGKSYVNLELTGPGGAVLQEFQNMKRQAHSGWAGDNAPAMRKVVGSIRQYLYRRPDSTNGGSSLLHTKTTAQVKDEMMNLLRDYMERGILVVASGELLKEMGSVRREPGSSPGAPNGIKDDRVVAAALAVRCWNDQLRSQLLSQGVFYTQAEEGQAVPESNPVQLVVDKFMTRIGILPAHLQGMPVPKKTAISGPAKWNAKLRRAQQSRSS